MNDTITCEWCAEEIPASSTRCPFCQGTVSPQGHRVANTPLAKTPPAPKPVEKAKAPAGWYDDPKMVNTRRYWDGQKWTEHRQEKGSAEAPAPAASSATPNAKDEPSFAWAIALLPLVLIPLLIYRPGVTEQWPFWITVAVITLILGSIDNRVLRSRGLTNAPTVTSWGVPFYLIARTRQVGSTAAIPIVWFAAVSAAILTGVLAPAHYDYDSKVIEQDISSQYGDQLGQDVTVSCPSAHNVKAGDKIHCSAQDKTGNRVLVVVEFNDDDGGSYTFHAE